MNTRIRHLYSGLILAVAGLAPWASASAQTSNIELVGTLTEELRTAAKISAARVVVGVALRGPASDERPKVDALFPRGWSGELACARWLTSDALYWAYGNYRIRDDWEGALAHLQYPTGKAEIVGALGTDRMAVAITRGDCRSDSLEFVPALWNTTYPGDPQELAVFVNGRGADEVYILGGRSIDVTCQAVTHGGTVGFDHVCVIPVRAAEEPLELEVNRVRRGNPEDPVVIRVVGVGAP